MAIASLTGKDFVSINGRTITDLADGDAVTLTYPNELVALKMGKNGNSIYAFNEQGRQCDLTVRVIRGSADDRWFNGQREIMKSDFAAFVLMAGEFIKRVGDGGGNVRNDTYLVSGGVIVSEVESKTNSEGDTEQSVAIHKLKFANAPRTIG